MKILFLNPEYSYSRENPPLGLAYLAAYMVQKGHDVRIIDLNVESFGRDLFNKHGSIF